MNPSMLQSANISGRPVCSLPLEASVNREKLSQAAPI